MRALCFFAFWTGFTGVLNRVIASAVIKTPEGQAWICQLMPADFHGSIPDRSAADAVARLAYAWDREEAEVVLLDMRKGFDFPFSGTGDQAVAQATPVSAMRSP